jgi:hypothetical protein
LARTERFGLFYAKIRGRLRAMRNFWFVALAALAGCSNDPLPPADIQLLLGQENETWSADPAATTVRVELVTSEKRTLLGEAATPVSVITAKDPQVASGTIATVEATAVDAAGNVVVRGQSVPYLIYGFNNTTIPLFVGRSAAWSRPAGSLELGRNFPCAAVAISQFVIAAGGEGTDLKLAVPDIYDAIHWKVIPKQSELPRAPKSMAVAGRALLVIDDTGAAWVDLDGYEKPREPMAPMGLTFGEVSGGEVVELPDGSSYVVGGTRLSGEPTAKVLRIDRYGFFRALTLATPRRGAAAGVVAGNLVVWGGSADGAGAEVLNKAQDGFTALPFPADPTSGLGIANLEGNIAVLAGGKDAMSAAAPVRTFDVTCGADCATSDLTTLPVTLQRTHVYPLASGHFLVTGDAEDGEFRAFSLLTASGTPEIVERPLRERRKGATSLRLPNGQPAVLGGQNPETMDLVRNIESFFL